MCKNKILKTILAVSMLFVGAFSFGSNISAEENKGNGAFVVEQEYDNGDFNYSEDLSVRVQKNAQKKVDSVNDFRMYMNVETMLSWNEILQMSSLKFSNNNQKIQAPNWPEGGGESFARPISSGDYTTPVHIKFYYKDNFGQEVEVSRNVFYVIANAVHQCGWGFGNPFFETAEYTQQPGNPSFGSVVAGNGFSIRNNNEKNPLAVDISALFKKYEFSKETPVVTSLSDEMGEYIQYAGNPEGNWESSINENLSTITNDQGNEVINWDMKDIELPDLIENGSFENGVFTAAGLISYTDIETGKTTYYREKAYTLWYDFALNTTKEGFLYNKVYDCNTVASVKYDLGEYKNKDVNFLVPKVKTEYIPDLVEVSKTSTKIEDTFNKFKIKLDVNTKEAQGIEVVNGVDIVLVIDVSGSMNKKPESGVTTYLESAKAAAIDFLNNEKINNGKNRFAVVTFDYYEKNLLHGDNSVFTSDANIAIETVKKVTIDSNTNNGGTNIQAGIYRARTLLDERPEGEQDIKGNIVLLSDGKPTGMNPVEGEKDFWGSKYVSGARIATKIDQELGYYLEERYSHINKYKWVYEKINRKPYAMIQEGNEVPREYVQHGNEPKKRLIDAYQLTENEALHAKLKGYTMFTIGYNLNDTSTRDMLKRSATPEKDGTKYAYNAKTDDLSKIYDEIAQTIVLQIDNIIKNGIVTDPMSDYVNLLGLEDGTYEAPGIDGKLEFSVGTIEITSDAKGKQTITWSLGNVGDNEKLTLEYYVELKEAYIDGMDYLANDPTTLTYKDYLDNDRTKVFEIPTVREQLLKLTISKNVINDDPTVVENNTRKFMVHVVGRDLINENVIYKTDILIKDKESIVLTDLPIGKYTVSEVIPMEYTLDNVIVKNGVGSTTYKNPLKVDIELTAKQGEFEGFVELTNRFAHQGYFKNDDEVENIFKGSVVGERMMHDVSRNNKSL